jgi:small subunit ribosomal protein S4
MGDPRKTRKTYSGPRHPWQKARIEEEKVLLREFGLKNKTEIYKHNSMIKRMINHYKDLNSVTTSQADVEKKQLLSRAHRLGLMPAEKDITAMLDLTVRDALERRLQTVLFKKKLARSVKQARQFITHRHVMINGRVVDAPSYIVPVSEEDSIVFIERSALSDEMHPERNLKKEEPVAEEAPAEENTEEKKAEEKVAEVEVNVDDSETEDEAEEKKDE